MARKKKPEPFWRSERNCYFVQIGKRQIRLSPDETEAWRLYHELMAKPPKERKPAPASTGLVVEILDAFLEWTKTNQAEKTYTWHRDHIQNFVSTIPATLTGSCFASAGNGETPRPSYTTTREEFLRCESPARTTRPLRRSPSSGAI